MAKAKKAIAAPINVASPDEGFAVLASSSKGCERPINVAASTDAALVGARVAAKRCLLRSEMYSWVRRPRARAAVRKAATMTLFKIR
jgi:hypothetical protein